MKTWVKVVFLVSVGAAIAWFVLTGKSRFITSLVARRWLARLDDDLKIAQQDLKQLERKKGADSEAVLKKRQELSQIEQRIEQQERVVDAVPEHLRDHSFNAWWDGRGQ